MEGQQGIPVGDSDISSCAACLVAKHTQPAGQHWDSGGLWQSSQEARQLLLLLPAASCGVFELNTI